MFTGSPAHVSTLSGPTIFGLVSGQLCHGGRWRCRPRCRGFPVAFRPPALASWASCPAEAFRPSYDRPTSHRRRWARRSTGPRRGFHFPLTRVAAGLGALFTPRPRGALVTGLMPPATTRPLCQGPGPIAPVTIPPSGAPDNEASSRVHSRSPARPSPRPGDPRMERGLLGHKIPGFAPRRPGACDARRGGRRALEHLPGAMSPASPVLQST